MVCAAQISGDREVYFTDGTSSFSLLSNIYAGGSSNPKPGAARDSNVLFAVENDGNGSGFYMYADGSVLDAVDIRPGLVTPARIRQWSIMMLFILVPVMPPMIMGSSRPMIPIFPPTNSKPLPQLQVNLPTRRSCLFQWQRRNQWR